MTRVDRSVIVLMMQLRRILVKLPLDILRVVLHNLTLDRYKRLHTIGGLLQFPGLRGVSWGGRSHKRGWAGTRRQVEINNVISRMLSPFPYDKRPGLPPQSQLHRMFLRRGDPSLTPKIINII